jgi:hypothetical protein
MNTQSENPEYLVDTDGETSVLLAPAKQDLAYISPADLPDLETAEAGFSLEATYKKFVVPGETFRAVFNGFTTIHKNENGQIMPMTAVVLQNKDGLFLNSTSNILDQLQRIPAGTAIQIKYLGDQKTASGYNVKKFEIRVLNVATINIQRIVPPQEPVQAKEEPPVVAPAKETTIVTPAWVVNNGYAVHAKDERGRIAEASNIINLLGLAGKPVSIAEPKIIAYIAWREEGLSPQEAAANVIGGKDINS